MAYGKKYQIDFDSIPGESYHLEIHKKDYAGAVFNRIGAAVPVLHKWNTDDPKAAIKGSVIEVKLINENGNLPLSDFFSVEDDTFLFKFYHGLNLKFIGYMVQDDCNEEMLDFTHVINLSATDNLGLLKDVALDESEKAFGLVSLDTGVNFGTIAPNIFSFPIPIFKKIKELDRITITGTAIDGVYNVVSVDIALSHVIVAETVTTAAYTGAAVIISRREVKGRYSLAQIFNLALAPTNLSLACNVYSKIKPVGGSTGRWLEDTFIDSYTFLSGEKFNDCYKVLETILSRFKATLFQANGVWNIVRWDELRQYNNAIEGFSYTSSMVYNTTITLNDVFDAGIGELTIAETGLNESILRPYKFAKETFDYKSPPLLRNANFTNVGALLQTYTSGTDTIFEYEMNDWNVGYEWTTGGGGYLPSLATRFIRVVIDNLGNEKERYGVIKGASGFDDWACAESIPIELAKDDIITFSFDYKTNVSQTPKNSYFRLNLVTTAPYAPRSANNRYVNAQGKWTVATTILSAVIPPENTNKWQSVEVVCDPLPSSGIVLVKLAQAVASAGPSSETHYKNFRFEIKFAVADNLKITGQTHTDTQLPTINNNSDKDIAIDDSPRNSIAGTLFLSSFTGPLQNRTTKWQRGAIADQYRLGELITYDDLFNRRIQRSKLEGTLYGLLQSTHLSLLTLIRYNYFATSNFVTGSCEIDYRNDNARVTLYEMYKDTEDESQLSEIYTFKYLYEKR